MKSKADIITYSGTWFNYLEPEGSNFTIILEEFYKLTK